MAEVDCGRTHGLESEHMEQMQNNAAAYRMMLVSPDGDTHKHNKSDSDLSMAQTPPTSAGSSCSRDGLEGNPVLEDDHHMDPNNSPEEDHAIVCKRVGLPNPAATPPTQLHLPGKDPQKKGKKINGYQSVVDHLGTRISGMWKDSMLHGKAVLHFSNGASFSGEFKDGLIDGYGEWRGKDGECYKGEWKNSYTHGKGAFRWADGSCYKGDWHWGIMDGMGRFASADGSMYEGQFADGKRHGMGRVRLSNGDVQHAIWYTDIKWITYCYQYANGDIYKRNGATKFSLDLDKEKPPAPPKPEPSMNPSGLGVPELGEREAPQKLEKAA